MFHENMIPLPQKPRIIQKEGNTATFEIDGLYPGYGVTLGNALRRVLFSSLEGAAITSVRIKGAPHEFSTIPGILEDVIEIIINLKQIRFTMEGLEPQLATLTKKGEWEIKASDIKTSSQLEVINKGIHVATLTSKKSEIDIELFVEKGLGYIPAGQRKKGKTEIGTILIDAIFTPIRKVNFEVENMRVAERTDFNRLRLFIETDGSITPEKALNQASEILVEHFNLCAIEEAEKPQRQERGEESAKGKEAGEDVLETKIGDVKLSARTINALIGGGVKTIAGLVRKSEKDLLGLEGLGEKGLKEIKKALKKYNLELKVSA